MSIQRLLVSVLMMSSLAFADSAGTKGYELLRVDGFARSSALSGSQIAVGGELHSLFTNPAGLTMISRQVGSVGYFKHVLDMNAGNLAYARPVNGVGVIGIGITYFDYGRFDKANEFGQKEGEFGASDILVTASGARSLTNKFDLGISLKYLNSSIDAYSASALVSDIGMIYRTGYENWDVGGGVFNAGFAMSSYLEEKDDVPTSYRLGLSAPLEHLPVRFSVMGDYADGEKIRANGGLELSFSPNVQGRLGYGTVGIDQRVGLDRDALAGFSAGIGIKMKRLSLDYALSSLGEIGFVNRFSLSADLGQVTSSR